MKTLKYAWRFLIRSKSYTIINLLGLAFSLACCIILFRYIHRELTVDSHCIDREQVYGVKADMGGNKYLSMLINRGDSSLIDQRYINKQSNFIPLEKDHIMVGANRFPSRIIVTDSIFFQLFRYPVVQGNITLPSPHSALVTEAFAHKLFGKENPVGKIIRCSNGKDITIEGVLGNPGNKTFLQFDVVLSKALSDNWERMAIDLFSFMPGTDINKLNKTGSIPRYINSPESGDTRTYTYSLIPVKQFYWDSSISNEETLMFSAGSYSHLWIMIGVCLLVLLAGIINFINIYLVVMLRRGKENQLNMLLSTEPGFRTKDIIIAQLTYESKDFNTYTEESMKQQQERVNALNKELSSCPYIEDFETSYIDILKGDYGSDYINEQGRKIYLNMRLATPHFFRVYDIKFIEGELPDLSDKGFFGVLVVNKAAMKALNYTTCQGASIENPLKRGNESKTQPIVAVVDDYYNGHLTLGKKPTVYMVSNQMNGDVYQIACVPGKKKEVLEFLRKTELKIYGSEDFEYSILEEDVKAIYAQDRQTSIIYSVFACIAIIIVGLGLFGISLFDIRQRYREIAIRKVNGAQLRNLYVVLFRKYIWVIGISILITIPLSYYLIYIYTQDFVVKAPISIFIYSIAILIVSGISLGTLFWQVNKAARINPAKIMKSE